MPLDCELQLLVDAEAIVAIVRLSYSSNALSSSSLSRCATISSYNPLSKRVILTDRSSFGGSLAYSKMSILFSPNAFVTHWFSSSKKKVRQFHGIRVKNEPMPFVFCRSLGIRFYKISPEYDQDVLQGLTIS